jgi:hypothetical protein
MKNYSVIIYFNLPAINPATIRAVVCLSVIFAASAGFAQQSVSNEPREPVPSGYLRTADPSTSTGMPPSTGDLVLGVPKRITSTPPQKAVSLPEAPRAKVVPATPPAELLAKHPVQPKSDTAAQAKGGALGLARIAAQGDRNLSKDKYDVDPLDPGPGNSGVRKAQQQGIAYLSIDPNQEWSRTLRGAPKNVLFVSFSADASLNSVVSVGGAWLAVQAGDKPSQAEVMIGEPAKKGVTWRKLGYRVPTATFGGREQAQLPVFTLRLDPKAGVWDVFSSTSLVASGLALDSAGSKGQREFTLHGGRAGASLNSLVTSDENPLFVDANSNGIDDAFEQGKNGVLLDAGASETTRRAMAAEWQKATRNTKPSVQRVVRPVPDRIAVAKGKD